MKTALFKTFTLFCWMEIFACITEGETFTAERTKNTIPLKVLLVGNSQCPVNIFNQFLEILAASDKDGPSIKLGGCMKGWASLKSHWKAGPFSGSALEMIASSN